MTYDNCWIWPAGKTTAGYGRLKVNGKIKRAHRMIYEMAIGEIPVGMEVLHSCDTPACVNPSHLRVGTHAENMKEAAERLRIPTGLNHFRGKVSDEQVNDIRGLSGMGTSQKEIAEKYGLHQSHVSRILSGSRR